MTFALLVIGMLVYTVGVLTGVYIGYKMAREIAKNTHKRAPNPEDEQKILAHLQKRGKLTNNAVEKLLGVSDATSSRYLTSLERSGKLTQHGKTGRDVYYTAK